MKLSFPIMALLITALIGSLFTMVLFDEKFTDTYSPNSSEISGGSYGDLFSELNQTYNRTQTTILSIENKTKAEDEATIFSIGSGVITAIKGIANLFSLSTMNNLLTSFAGIIGIPALVVQIITYMILVIVIFAIIGAILRWRT